MAIVPGLASDDPSTGLSENTKQSDRVKKELSKKYGAKVFKSGAEILEKKNEIIKIGPALNAGLNGGVPDGTISIISGKQKSGKTTTLLSMMAMAQSIGKHVYYHDVEYRLKPMNLAGIQGLKIDTEHLTIVRSEQGSILKAEDHLSIIEHEANSHTGAVIIVDSASALCSEKEFNAGISAATRADGPKLMAQLTRKLSNVIAVNNISLWVVLHLINNTSGYGAKFIEDSGVKLQYALDTKLKVKDSKPWTIGSGENEKVIGLILTWTIVTGALSSLPGTECTSYIRYGVGVDKVMEYIDLGLKLGFINKAGAWFSYGDDKFQGEQKMYDYFVQNSDKLSDLKTKLCDIYGFQI